MRTTLTIDDDVARLLKKESRRSGSSFKETVNQFLRLGLTAGEPESKRPFRVTPRNLGLPQGLSYDNVSELVEAVEGPEHK